MRSVRVRRHSCPAEVVTLDSCSPQPQCAMPMDVERSPPVSSPEPPDDGDPRPPTPPPHPPTDTPVPTTTPTPTTVAPLSRCVLPPDVDGSLEPLIERPKFKPDGLLGDAENGNNNNNEQGRKSAQYTRPFPGAIGACCINDYDSNVSHGQPQARSTPIHPTQPCLTQPTSQLRNGAKHHIHTPHTHGPHCTHTPHTHHPHTHASHPNGVRNGGSHDQPAPGSLPRAASSSSSSSSSGMKNPKKLQSNPSITSQRSKSSSKSNSSQIPTEAQDDCCVHCILACLFCEFLTLCNIVLDCATCGSCAGDDSACFCCCCASEECGDCELPCDMDCGIIDACCESTDCLEICMECCGLCFSS
ncbi:unnamed protein product [Coregonus sp. 'balchen']|nr:unnamed protein product [Coregonus sp. 'balchen']